MNRSSKKPPRPKPTHTTEIKIVLPVRLELPESVRRLREHRLFRVRIIAIAAIVVVGLVLAGYINHRMNSNTPVATEAVGLNLIKGTPKFDTVSPAGKNIDDMGGWTRITPEGKDPAYAYVDKVDDVSLSVSQQPLPADLASNPDESVAKIASDFNATEKLSIDDNTVYIGTSGNGPQSIIFHKNSLLVLIKSSDRLSNDQWALYIKSLN